MSLHGTAFVSLSVHCLLFYDVQSLRLRCSLDTFYRTFLADEAPFSFDRFQREHIRDHNVIVTQWEPDPSNNDDADNNDSNRGILQQARTLSFTHPIKKGVGPTEAHTRRRQVVRRYGPHGITFQNTTHIEGIPAADCFSVHDFWTIAPIVDETKDDGQRTTVIVNVRFAPRFTKRTLFRSVIERNIKRETKQWFASYETMTREVLEQAKEELNEASEQSEMSLLQVKPDESATPDTRIRIEQERFLLSSSGLVLCLVLVLVLIIVVLVLVILILQVLQTREALSILQQDLAGLHLENQQLLRQQWMLIAAQQQHPGQIVDASSTADSLVTSALTCANVSDCLTA